MSKNIKFYSNLISIVLILFGIGLLFTNSISLAQGGTWVTKKNMPTKRYGLAASVVGGKIYAIGGSPSASTTPAPPPLATLEVYDPITDTWDTTKTPMPTARKWLCSSVVNGKIYAIGGGIYGGPAFKTVEEYDPITDTWDTTKTPMPTARATASSSVVDGKIYVIGGESALHGVVLAAVEEYDPLKDTWTKKANMPIARFCLITEVVDDKIYAIGGLDATYATLDIVQVYDPVTDKWSEAKDMPTARFGPCGGEVNKKIYVIGGMKFQGYIFYSTVEEYDPALNKWKKMLDMPTKRWFPASGVVDGKIYVMGGVQATYSPAISVVEEYTPPPHTMVKNFFATQSTELLLHQNYPNPFNPVTMINYQLPMTSAVELSIYNILGQKVVTLVNKKQTEGSYEVEWNASNMASGVYLYRIKAGDFVEIKKMVVMK